MYLERANDAALATTALKCSFLAPAVATSLSRMSHMTRALLAVATLAAVAPVARAQSDEQAVKAVLGKMFDGMRSRDSAMMRSTMVPSTMLDRVSATGTLGEPIVMNAFIDRVAAGTGPGGDEQIKDPKIQIDGPMASVWT